MQTVWRLVWGNQSFSRVNGVRRHDQPAVGGVQVSVWGPAGDGQGDAAAPLQRPGHCGAAGEWVLACVSGSSELRLPETACCYFCPPPPLPPTAVRIRGKGHREGWRSAGELHGHQGQRAGYVCPPPPPPLSPAICVSRVRLGASSDLWPLCPQPPPWLSWERTRRTRTSWPRPWTRPWGTSPSPMSLCSTCGAPSATPRWGGCDCGRGRSQRPSELP